MWAIEIEQVVGDTRGGQHFQDALGEVFVDLGVSRNRLRNLLASLERQLSELADPWDFATCQVLIQIPEMGLQLFEGLSLRPVIGIVLQIAEPLTMILPVDVVGRFHISHHIASSFWIAKRGDDRPARTSSV